MATLNISTQIHSLRWKTILRPYCKTVRETCEAALLGAGFGIRDSGFREERMTVVLADDAFIRKLNRDFRGKDKATNVLSFPESRIPNPESYLGDLVLAHETIEREAHEQGKKVRDHVKHLLVHGTLHLLGHDHEEDKEAAQMEALEVKILKKLGVGNPYL